MIVKLQVQPTVVLLSLRVESGLGDTNEMRSACQGSLVDNGKLLALFYRLTDNLER